MLRVDTLTLDYSQADLRQHQLLFMQHGSASLTDRLGHARWKLENVGMGIRLDNGDELKAWLKRNLHKLTQIGLPPDIAADYRRFSLVVQNGEDKESGRQEARMLPQMHIQVRPNRRIDRRLHGKVSREYS